MSIYLPTTNFSEGPRLSFVSKDVIHVPMFQRNKVLHSTEKLENLTYTMVETSFTPQTKHVHINVRK
jgi:hypothetical protein